MIPFIWKAQHRQTRWDRFPHSSVGKQEWVSAKPPQSSLTLCNPRDCRASGSSVQGFFSQEHWSGFLPPGNLSDSGMEPAFLASSALAGSSLPLAPPGGWYCQMRIYMWCNAGDTGSNPGSGRSPGEGNGYPLQHLAWEIPWTEERGGLQSTGS